MHTVLQRSVTIAQGSTPPLGHESWHLGGVTGRPSSLLRLMAGIVAASTAIALLETAGDLLRTPTNTFGWIFPRLLAAWVTGGMLAPGVIVVARRIRFGTTPTFVAFVLHGTMAFVFAAAHYALLVVVHRLMFNAGPQFWNLFRELYLYYVHFDVITYGLIVGAVHAWMSHVDARDRELATQTLRADLSEAKLQALRAQLHPHFLFNAMNTIAMLVRGGDNARAVGTVTTLSDLLRRVLRENVSHQVPLREELDFARQYFAIERTRFGDRLRVTIDAADDALDLLVPDLVLQPLVENAMHHGAARTSRACHVAVRARRVEGVLTLTVSDDSMGLPAGWSPAALGVGLGNTAARLTQLHGDSARLQVANNDAGGVTVTVTLPATLHNPRASLHKVAS